MKQGYSLYHLVLAAVIPVLVLLTLSIRIDFSTLLKGQNNPSQNAITGGNNEPDQPPANPAKPIDTSFPQGLEYSPN